MKSRKHISAKSKALLQKEIKSICPFCTNEDVDHFQIHHIDENPSNNEFINLLMLCPLCHSKITKGDIHISEVIRKKEGLKLTKITDRKDKKIELYNGFVGDYTNNTFSNFLFENDGKLVQLDIYLNEEQALEMQIPDNNEHGLFYYFHIPTPFDNNEGWHIGGDQIRIQVNPGSDFFYDDRVSARRLKGYFKVIGIVGPNQGWMTTLLKPVNIEALY